MHGSLERGGEQRKAQEGGLRFLGVEAFPVCTTAKYKRQKSHQEEKEIRSQGCEASVEL